MRPIYPRLSTQGRYLSLKLAIMTSSIKVLPTYPIQGYSTLHYPSMVRSRGSSELRLTKVYPHSTTLNKLLALNGGLSDLMTTISTTFRGLASINQSRMPFKEPKGILYSLIPRVIPHLRPKSTSMVGPHKYFWMFIEVHRPYRRLMWPLLSRSTSPHQST